MKGEKIKTMIVDDVPKAISVLEQLIKAYCPGLEVVGTAVDTKSAFEKIRHLGPDLVFLDIEMSASTGFDLLELFPDIDFSVIFVTAHAQYSLRALKLSAVDYLLKPISIKDLVAAVAKAEQVIELKAAARQSHHHLPEGRKDIKSSILAISTMEGLEFLEVSEIIRLEASGKYTRIILSGNKEILSSKNIKAVEAKLPQEKFFRVHRSHLINLIHIQQYFRGDGGYVVMTDGSTVSVSKNRKDAFIRCFEV